MSKLFKFIFIGLMSVFIGALSSSIYAKKGGVPGGPDNEGMGNIGKGHGQFKAKKEGKFDNRGAKGRLSVGPESKWKFSDKDRTVITNFFSSHPFTTTGLPPGIAKNLARGKPLPPGIAKVYLPNDLNKLLVVYPGYDYLVAGRDVLLVNQSTQIIADILYNILR